MITNLLFFLLWSFFSNQSHCLDLQRQRKFIIAAGFWEAAHTSFFEGFFFTPSVVVPLRWGAHGWQGI
ncbi:hypothetical protein, partial [Acinetobacter baumannii]|uniref:hypothetical protein n=1 Tax=Acinetobacter baumannii TaxID=470 RepID=UPI00197AC5D6